MHCRMFQIKSQKTKKVEKKDKPSSSAFSDFFRKAPAQDKKRVFLDVAKKASAEQSFYMK